jgi:Leucine Rich repeat
MTESVPGPLPQKRRWLRFSLRTIFVLVTLYCGWLAFLTVRAREQHRAVDRIEQLHGAVAYGFEIDDEGNWKRNAQPLVPAWVRGRMGEDYFRRVAIVNFHENADPTDDDLQVLERLSEVQQLSFSNCRRITDDGLPHLSNLANLKILVLDGTRIAGPGLRNLLPLGHLEGLTFSSTPLSDDGLENLAALPNLKWLHLNDTNITDDGLQRLSTSRSLQSLQLVNTRVTNVGLKHLESLHGLKSVLLRGTKTTPEGRAALRKALPNCRVPD